MKLKKTLDVVKTLDRGFKKRTLSGHVSDCPVKTISFDNHQEIIVFDASISEKILISKSFSSIDYFKPGIEHLTKAGESIKLLSAFYNQSILFKEGKEHDTVKKAFHYLLEDLSTELQKNKQDDKDIQHNTFVSDQHSVDILCRMCFDILNPLSNVRKGMFISDIIDE